MRATPPPPAATTPLDLLEGGESGRGLADRDAAVRRSRVRERDAHEAEGHGNQRRCDSFAHMRFLLFSLDQAGPDTTAPPESTSVRITVPANPRRMTRLLFADRPRQISYTMERQFKRKYRGARETIVWRACSSCVHHQTSWCFAYRAGFVVGRAVNLGWPRSTTELIETAIDWVESGPGVHVGSHFFRKSGTHFRTCTSRSARPWPPRSTRNRSS